MAARKVITFAILVIFVFGFSAQSNHISAQDEAEIVVRLREMQAAVDNGEAFGITVNGSGVLYGGSVESEIEYGEDLVCFTPNNTLSCYAYSGISELILLPEEPSEATDTPQAGFVSIFTELQHFLQSNTLNQAISITLGISESGTPEIVVLPLEQAPHILAVKARLQELVALAQAEGAFIEVYPGDAYDFDPVRDSIYGRETEVTFEDDMVCFAVTTSKTMTPSEELTCIPYVTVSSVRFVRELAD